MAWTLLDIRTKVRELIGRPSVNQISDVAVNKLINDFYTADFVRDVLLDQIKEVFRQELTCTDAGTYPILNTYFNLKNPAFIDFHQIHLTFDVEYFFEKYPEDEDTLDSASIGLGSTSEANIEVDDFAYIIEGYSYHTDGVEGALTGSNVPTGKFAAWLVEIEEDGTLVITQATDNSTGYASERLAMEGLPTPSDGRACCGFVVIYNGTGAVFIPGTTLLSAANITEYFVNGDPNHRSLPEMALYWNNTITVRPRSNDRHLFECECMKKQTALTADDDTPSNEDWGPAIAYGTAIKFLAEHDQSESQPNLPGLYDREIENFQLEYYRNLQQREPKRSF